jgi:hypothetical protein
MHVSSLRNDYCSPLLGSVVGEDPHDQASVICVLPSDGHADDR